MRQRERGAMMPIMAGAMLLLAMVGIGSLTIMRIVLARQEAQRVADSACLAATTIVKTAGLPFDGGKQDQARAIAGGNHPGMSFAITFTELPETPDKITFECQASITVSAPLMIWAGGQVAVSTTATAAVGQVTLTDASKKYPKLVLVLDYSGSMIMRGLLSDPSGPKSITILKQEVNALLAKNYDIKLGLVLFADNAFDKVQVALNNTQKVKTDVNKSWHCPATDGNCNTASWDGLKAAHTLLGPWDNDEERYVLFISDGQPGTMNVGVEDGIKYAEAEAKGLFDDAHANIITLQLINTTDHQQDLQKFMQDISGSPEHHPDPCSYFNADSQQQLDSVLTAIGNAIACPLKLDQPIPAHTAVHVFLRDGSGFEEALGDASQVALCTGASTCGGGVSSPYATTPGDLSDQLSCTYYQGDYFLYYAPKQSIYVTPQVCDKIMNDHDTVIIRYARTHLTK